MAQTKEKKGRHVRCDAPQLSEETPNRSSVNRRRKATKEAIRFLGADRTRRTKLKRSRRFRMRGSASYSYPTHSKQMNHAPKWPTEFRRHVASAHANQRVHGTRVHTLTRLHARHRHAGPGRAEPGHAEQRAQAAHCTRNFTRTKRRDCSCCSRWSEKREAFLRRRYAIFFLSYFIFK